jgi:hypothetical protein
MIEGLADASVEVLEGCIARGMTMPFIVVAASKNGSVAAFRFRDGEADYLVEHFVDRSFVAPVTIMVLDQNDEVARVTLEAKGVALQ